jgi:YidC/Oxa1 family membrane protein insertase
MDKQTTLGFILIGIVLIVWMWLQTPPPRQHTPLVVDTVHQAEPAPKESTKTPTVASSQVGHQTSTTPESLGKYFSGRASGEERILIVKTSLYTAEISSKGALIRKWELHNYRTWDQLPVQLIDFDRGGDFSLLFTSSDGKLINTRSLYFNWEFPNWKTVQLKGDETFSVDADLSLGEGRRIVKRFVFRNGRYSFDANLVFVQMQNVISNFEYQIIWENGVRYAEHNSVDESSFATAYAYSGGELAEVDATHTGEVVKRDINGSTDWVATRVKYFAVAMVPEQGRSQGAYLEGAHIEQPNKGVRESYTLALKMPLKGEGEETARIQVFLGPLDFDVVKSYGRGLEQIMSLGSAWIIRPISEYVMIPLFQLLRLFIPNFGVIIIVFSIIIKVALHPLTRTSMKSMKRMQALQPLMNEIREKHKDDPQKMNQQIMHLYKEYGVNPAAGCLPLLLQMPILFALYSVFRASIELRQASFVWWIHDLSIADTVFHLPFAIPLFGITDVSGLALAMGITMFVQQKMTVTDPRQKAMVWMMPVMMTLVFNSLPSGLNLYYFVFNLLSIGQQAWINKQHRDEPLRRVDSKKKTGGFLGRLTKDLPRLK